ncbi:ClbS/DfsB family four-helix bundle protein [Mycoplasmatota bacterium]|nr:ClbS/DfsB family four-helix bundle protein [Mycoplasmatota bacterium]
MPRPQTKEALIELSNKNFDQLINLIKKTDNQIISAPFQFNSDASRQGAHWKRDENISDVLTHLYAWHQILKNWIMKNIRAIETPFLPAPYTFKTYGKLNLEIQKKYQGTSLEDIIKSLTNEILFTKSYFKWTGTTSLGCYCISATSSHYDWAFKKIKKHIKIMQTKKS